MAEYTIKGDHPISKRIDHIAIGLDGMHREIDELLDAGYQVTIEQRPLPMDLQPPDYKVPDKKGWIF